MFRNSLVAALTLTALTGTIVQAETSKRMQSILNGDGLHMAAFHGGQDRIYQRPPASYKGQWFTTANGCSYSRTNPPGGVPMWYLIQNPHHIGQANAHDGCAQVL
jgi:hypothetical protein